MHLTVHQLHEIIGGELLLGPLHLFGADEGHLVRVVTDSRTVRAGDVFWGLKGSQLDGSSFADEALTRGAAGVVVEGQTVEPRGDRFYIRVADAQQALWKLAAHHRDYFRGATIAVTGSVGKTTTREMIACVLRRSLQGTSSGENYNNHVGLPLSMLSMEQTHDFAVLELGASCQGEIAALAQLCRPTVAAITCIGEAHLAGFGSQEAIALTKTELLQALPHDGHAVLNGDDPWLRRLCNRPGANITWVGRGGDNDVVATRVVQDQGQLEFNVQGFRFRTAIWGRHYLTSALVAIGVGKHLGLKPEEIAAGLAEFQSVRGCCEVTKWAGATLINDYYSSSPTALHAALRLMRNVEVPGRRVVVLGDMQELGNGAKELHRQMGNEVVTACGADLLITVGDYREEFARGARDAGMPAEKITACIAIESVAALLRWSIQPGDVVLIKGSRAMRMERITQALAWQPKMKAA